MGSIISPAFSLPRSSRDMDQIDNAMCVSVEVLAGAPISESTANAEEGIAATTRQSLLLGIGKEYTSHVTEL